MSSNGEKYKYSRGHITSEEVEESIHVSRTRGRGRELGVQKKIPIAYVRFRMLRVEEQGENMAGRARIASIAP